MASNRINISENDLKKIIAELKAKDTDNIFAIFEKANTKAHEDQLRFFPNLKGHDNINLDDEIQAELAKLRIYLKSLSSTKASASLLKNGIGEIPDVIKIIKEDIQKIFQEEKREELEYKKLLECLNDLEKPFQSYKP